MLKIHHEHYSTVDFEELVTYFDGRTLSGWEIQQNTGLDVWLDSVWGNRVAREGASAILLKPS